MASKNDKSDKRGPSYSQLAEGTRRAQPILHQTRTGNSAVRKNCEAADRSRRENLRRTAPRI